MSSIHHRHRRPPPAHDFTSDPPIHVADLSRPPTRQPSHPGLPIPQLLAPRRRHRPHLRPVLLSSHDARFQSEPPWGHSFMSTITSSIWRKGPSNFRSAKTHLNNQVLPHRLGAWSRLAFRSSPFLRHPLRHHTRPRANQQRHGGLISAARPRWRELNCIRYAKTPRHCGETGTSSWDGAQNGRWRTSGTLSGQAYSSSTRSTAATRMATILAKKIQLIKGPFLCFRKAWAANRATKIKPPSRSAHTARPGSASRPIQRQGNRAIPAQGR